MIDDSYSIFDENLEKYGQYPGRNELFEELQVVSLVAGSCQVGWGVGGYLARNITGRLVLGALASGAKYKLSSEFFNYLRANEKEIKRYLNSLQDDLESRLKDRQ